MQLNIKQSKGANTGSILYVGSGLKVTEAGKLFYDASSDNFGIGLTGPSSSLHIKGISNVNTDYSLIIDDSTNKPLLYLQNDGAVCIGPSNAASNVKLAVRSAVLGSDVIVIENPAGTIYRLSIGLDASQDVFFDTTNAYYHFKVSATDIMSITNVGLGIGTTTPSTKLHISSATPGVFRLEDTTQAAGYILVSDANGVGTWTASSGGSINANNGLTVSSGIVQLGGPLVQDTLIGNTTWSFTMSSTSTIDLQSTSGAGQISKLSTDITATTFEMYDFGGGTGYVNIKLYNTQQTIGDGSTNNQMVIMDQQAVKGLVYDQDYSANFTTYSLVTKGYVNSLVGTSSVTGPGTTNYIPYWLSATQLSSTSSIIDSGTEIGIGTQSNATYKVNVQGDVNILGTLYATSKSFEITHPLDPTKRLTYGSLEGPEYGVYFRGKLEKNSIIDLPDYWTGLVDETTITVNITPIGYYQRIFVNKIENNKVYLGVDNSGLPDCYYIVYAERKDIPKIIVE